MCSLSPAVRSFWGWKRHVLPARGTHLTVAIWTSTPKKNLHLLQVHGSYMFYVQLVNPPWLCVFPVDLSKSKKTDVTKPKSSSNNVLTMPTSERTTPFKEAFRRTGIKLLGQVTRNSIEKASQQKKSEVEKTKIGSPMVMSQQNHHPDLTELVQRW